MASFYRPPGVYPDIIPSPELVQLSQTARVPVVIGRGQRSILVYERILHRALVYGADALGYEIADAAILGTHQIVAVGDYPDQIKYHEGTDFQVVDLGGGISGILWLGVDDPDVGAYFFITYKKPVPDSQYDYHLYTDANQLIAVHGEEQTAYPSVSTGGILAFRNGAIGVGVIQINTDAARDPELPEDTDLYTAFINTIPILEQLDTRFCRYIVPMTTLGDDVGEPDVFNEFLDHVNIQSLVYNRRWRMIIRGMRALATQSNTTTKNAFIALAGTYAPTQSARRMIVVSPAECYRVVKDPTTGISARTLFDGCILAAAAAGRICSYDNPAVTITWKSIVGLTFDRVFSVADMNAIAEAGVSIFMHRGRDIICRHAMTTDNTNANTQEISVVEAEDYIKVQSIFVLEDRYIGSLIVAGLEESISSTLSAFLEQLIRKQAIADYDSGSISVHQDDLDPRIIDIYFRVKPAYPLNWIDIKFQFYAGSTSQ